MIIIIKHQIYILLPILEIRIIFSVNKYFTESSDCHVVLKPFTRKQKDLIQMVFVSRPSTCHNLLQAVSQAKNTKSCSYHGLIV